MKPPISVCKELGDRTKILSSSRTFLSNFPRAPKVKYFPLTQRKDFISSKELKDDLGEYDSHFPFFPLFETMYLSISPRADDCRNCSWMGSSTLIGVMEVNPELVVKTPSPTLLGPTLWRRCWLWMDSPRRLLDSRRFSPSLAMWDSESRAQIRNSCVWIEKQEERKQNCYGNF